MVSRMTSGAKSMMPNFPCILLLCIRVKQIPASTEIMSAQQSYIWELTRILRCCLDSLQLSICVCGKLVDGDDHRDAVLLRILDVPAGTCQSFKRSRPSHSGCACRHVPKLQTLAASTL